MKINQSKCSAITMFVALTSGIAAYPVQAQLLDEVIVTATKRPVGMQDVPIALAVVSGQKITEQGIDDLTELAVFMPNVNISEGVSDSNIFIRGIGSGVNTGFEQSVGTFVDGVYFGRGQASRSSFLDIERVEVLKGSQSTLFGKNTIAGALNITTAKPGNEFEASIGLMAEPEFGGLGGTLTLSGPITDTFGARLVIKTDTSDGYMKNLLTGVDEAEQDTEVGRLTLSWQPTDELDLTFKYEHGELNRTGSTQKITIATPQAISIYESADPDFANTLGFNYNKSDANHGSPRDGENSIDSDSDIFTLTADWALGEYTLKSITGYVKSDSAYLHDADFGPLILFNRLAGEKHEQFTQEFLLTSPQSDTFEYLAGVYYQDEELDAPRFTDADLSSAGAPNATAHNTFKQDSETISAFFQGTAHVNDTFRVIAGLRYSKDEKEFEKSQIINSLYSNPGDPLPPEPFAGLLAAVYGGPPIDTVTHTFRDGVATVCEAVSPDPFDGVTCPTSVIETVRSENHVTGDIIVQWDATDEMMVYAKYGTGYKAGGFDEDNAIGDALSQQFEDEESEGVEVGVKMDLFEGRGRFNIAAYYGEFDDVQVSTFNGTSGFIVGNAAKSVTQGIEMDGMFAITDDLTVSAAVAFLDAAYDEFEDGPCTTAQIDANPGPLECTQDLSGESLQFAADVTANLNVTYTTAIADSLELGLSADVMYTDDFDLAVDHDENLVQKAYTKVNARISIGDIDGVWNIALLGKNLTDKTTSSWGSDIPFGGLGFAGSYYNVMEAPRSFVIQGNYNF